jgi:uncharacterized membrane protein YeaQ/YmgE (transglycosylase-associated protein family)
MDWTTSFITQAVAGLVGANLAAVALHEHRFGWLAHSLVGVLAGAVSGYFLQEIALRVVTGSGSANEPRLPEVAVIEALTGAVVGAIAMAAVGFFIRERAEKDR